MSIKTLTDKIANELNLQKVVVHKVLTSAIETIQKTVATGEEVKLPGFGTFKSKIRAAGKSRNILTGETIDVPERRVPRFVAGSTFKNLVKGE